MRVRDHVEHLGTGEDQPFLELVTLVALEAKILLRRIEHPGESEEGAILAEFGVLLPELVDLLLESDYLGAEIVDGEQGRDHRRDEEGEDGGVPEQAAKRLLLMDGNRTALGDEPVELVLEPLDQIVPPLDLLIELPKLLRGVLEDAAHPLFSLVRLLVRFRVLSVRALLDVVHVYSPSPLF